MFVSYFCLFYTQLLLQEFNRTVLERYKGTVWSQETLKRLREEGEDMNEYTKKTRKFVSEFRAINCFPLIFHCLTESVLDLLLQDTLWCTMNFMLY